MGLPEVQKGHGLNPSRGTCWDLVLKFARLHLPRESQLGQPTNYAYSIPRSCFIFTFTLEITHEIKREKAIVTAGSWEGKLYSTLRMDIAPLHILFWAVLKHTCWFQFLSRYAHDWKKHGWNTGVHAETVARILDKGKTLIHPYSRNKSD